MKYFQRTIALNAVALALGSAATAAAKASDIETVIFLRHGEKLGDPEKHIPSLGQLECKGLNRAMMLPPVIERIVAGRKLAAIFAPNPMEQEEDEGGLYDYVRPLATIEPTAIKNNMPVNAQIGYLNGEALAATLKNPDYRGAVVLVAWEHKTINEVECGLLTNKSCHWGDDNKSGDVVKWPKSEFDRVDLLEIDWSDGGKAKLLPPQWEHLNDVPDKCPWDK
jgi:hypothetical protein